MAALGRVFGKKGKKKKKKGKKYIYLSVNNFMPVSLLR